MGLYDGLDSAIPYAAMGVPSVSNATKQMQGLREMRAIDVANRVYGGPRQPRAPGGSNPFFSSAGAGSDYSAFTYDPAMRAQAEANGVSPLAPDQVRSNAVLPNSGFFGAHPRLSAGIEGAMFSAANTRGANTVGEGISNVMQGMIGGQQQRGQMLERQFEAPFQDAAALQGIKHARLQNDLSQSEIDFRRAQITKLGMDRPDPTPHYGDTKVLGDGSVQSMNTLTGQYEPSGLGPGSVPVKDPDRASPMGGGIVGSLIHGQLGDPPQAGTPAAAKYWKQATKMAKDMHYGMSYAGAEGGTAGRDATPTPNADARKDDRDQQKAVDAEKKFFSSRPVGYWLDKKLQDGSKIRSSDVSKQRQWYRENISSIGTDDSEDSATPAPSGNPYRH